MSTVLCRLVAPALITAAALSATENPDWTRGYFDLRVGWSSTPDLDISEALSVKNVDQGVVDWEGTDKRGNRLAITAIGGKSADCGGFFWGAGFATTRWDATPVNGYSANIARYNPGLYELTDWYHAVEIQAGYQYGIRNHDKIQAWLEVAPIASAGLVLAETETRVLAGYRVDGGTGFGYELGGRLGLYLGERNWLLGITSTLSSFRSEVDIDTADVGASVLVLRSVGARFGLEAGYRF